QMQGAALVGGDVIGLVALDLVLRFLRRSTATVALVVEVGGVDLRDGPRDLPGLGVPSHMVTDREFAHHDSTCWRLCFQPSTKAQGGKPGGYRLAAAGLSGSASGQVGDEGVDECFAGGDLVEFDELVGWVVLGDVPGPAVVGRDDIRAVQARL